MSFPRFPNGRDPGADICLDHSRVSKQHAVVTIVSDGRKLVTGRDSLLGR